jgi:solute carrier family 31 (copper transporter), member 1
MLWNWYTIDSCFISSTWHVRSSGGFAGTCIGVILLVMSLEMLRRLSKEYDTFVIRRFKERVARELNTAPSSANGSTDVVNKSHATTKVGTAAVSGAACQRVVHFRYTPLQQAIRGVLHAITFGVAYFVMLLAMYYNGYVIICILIGAGLGKIVFDWGKQTLSLGDGASDLQAGGDACETTVCCG